MARGGRSRLKYVVDACLWIDLNFGNLIPEIFELPYELCSPDVIIAELEGVDAKRLRAGGLIEVSLTPDDYPILTRLITTYRQPGINDLTALTIAIIQKKKLMTGDGSLRKAAAKEGITAIGVLGVLDQLVEHEIIQPARAASALEQMLENNARLPKAEYLRRLSKWRDRSL